MSEYQVDYTLAEMMALFAEHKPRLYHKLVLAFEKYLAGDVSFISSYGVSILIREGIEARYSCAGKRKEDEFDWSWNDPRDPEGKKYINIKIDRKTVEDFMKGVK